VFAFTDVYCYLFSTTTIFICHSLAGYQRGGRPGNMHTQVSIVHNHSTMTLKCTELWLLSDVSLEKCEMERPKNVLSEMLTLLCQTASSITQCNYVVFGQSSS